MISFKKTVFIVYILIHISTAFAVGNQRKLFKRGDLFLIGQSSQITQIDLKNEDELSIKKDKTRTYALMTA